MSDKDKSRHDAQHKSEGQRLRHKRELHLKRAKQHAREQHAKRARQQHHNEHEPRHDD